MHLRWEVPYRALLWSESLLRGTVENGLGIPWETWVTSSTIEATTQSVMRWMGFALLATALAAWRCRNPQRESRSGTPEWLLLLGGFSLGFGALLEFKDKLFHPAILMEASARVLAPLVLWALVRGWFSDARGLRVLKAATAITFLGHGLFAIGYFPVPGNFIDLTIKILGVDEPQARMVLQFAGALDIALAAAMLTSSRATRIALAYATAWGLLTALARPVAYLASAIAAPGGFSMWGLAYWVTEALSRAAHVGVPLSALLLARAEARALSLASSRDHARPAGQIRDDLNAIKI